MGCKLLIFITLLSEVFKFNKIAHYRKQKDNKMNHPVTRHVVHDGSVFQNAYGVIVVLCMHFFSTKMVWTNYV
jgi:hypothetical protein